ncbi:carboxylesterase family protein [Planoprotostelium fungivorum]|uniref:Carboxylic ester hydrolase n=1 Tax=Planoprotostelium fungivorum TaxID=1890364 RepID=A0A2P6NHS0_9EUKA|nr:carboxylesterase family protein [Planoprotostelium fungivorum]
MKILIALLFVSSILHVHSQEEIGGFTVGGVTRFLGIPYTDGPTQRFVEGVLPASKQPFHNGTAHGPICPQLRGSDANADENNCLVLDIALPEGTQSGDNLPVAIWIYGIDIYEPTRFVNHSINSQEPIIFVAMNYRLNGFGFLSSEDMAARNVLNLGLKDQRLAIKWVQKYISFFGGDSTKVTLMGESAGAISIGLHVTAYGNKKDTGLFRSAIMESGGPTSLSVPPFKRTQSAYDFMINATDCFGKNDPFKCLQFSPFEKFIEAVRSTVNFWGQRSDSLYSPVVDKDFIPSRPSTLIKSGLYSHVPLLIGENLDEGTLFVNRSVNAFQTDQQISSILKIYGGSLTSVQRKRWLQLYPNDPAVGSPYGTGNRTYYSEEYKRASSIFGDLVFVSARRFMVEQASEKSVPVWTYLFDYVTHPELINGTSYMGVKHADELASVFQWSNKINPDLTGYWISFINGQDPNSGAPKDTVWEQFDVRDRRQIRFSNNGTYMAADDYRIEQVHFVNSNLNQLGR